MPDNLLPPRNSSCRPVNDASWGAIEPTRLLYSKDNPVNLVSTEIWDGTELLNLLQHSHNPVRPVNADICGGSEPSRWNKQIKAMMDKVNINHHVLK